MMQKLDLLREEIKKIDAAIIERLAERQKLVKQVGQLKMQTGQAVFDPSREAQLMSYYQTLCEEHQLDPVFIQHLFGMIFSHSRSLQQ